MNFYNQSFAVRTFNGVAKVFGRFGLSPSLPTYENIQKNIRGSDLSGPVTTTSKALLSSAILSANTDDQLSDFGRWAVWSECQRMLSNEYAITRFLNVHANALEQTITAPVMVVGRYRSGTTLLHRLLCAAENTRATKAYETFFTVPPTSASMRTILDADRLVRAQKWRMKRMMALAHLAMPELKNHHRIEFDSPEESSVLLDNAGLGVYFLHAFAAHDHGRKLMHLDLCETYKALKMQLQILQYISAENRRRWVLKCPFTYGHLNDFLRVFPDAHIVCINRSEDRSLQSICNLAEMLQTSFLKQPRPTQIGAFWSEYYKCADSKFGEARKSVAAKRFHEVDYKQLTNDPAGTVTGLLAELELKSSENAVRKAENTTRHSSSHEIVSRNPLSHYGLPEQNCSP